MPENREFDDYTEDGLCVICGKPTVRPGRESVDHARDADKEPFVCNRCLVDLRGDMATELEVRRRLTQLEAITHGLQTKLWYQSNAFTVAMTIIGVLVGALLTLATLWLS